MRLKPIWISKYKNLRKVTSALIAQRREVDVDVLA